MDKEEITLLVAGIGAAASFLTFWLTKSSQESRARREERRQEYRELVSTLTQCYMRIVSPYDPPIPVIDEQLQRQIMDAKLESFKVLQDRIAIADELAETDVLDEWTEAIVSLERNADSVRFAKKFKPLRERIIRMANHPAPKKSRLRSLFYRIRYFSEIRQFKRKHSGA
ncbi:MAG: hypothetical protein ABSB30_09860 [Terracidiphilus sp.]